MPKTKILRVDPNLIITILNWMQNPDCFIALPITEQIPEGTKVTHVHYDFATQTLEFLITHESFEEVPPWVYPPAIFEPLPTHRTVKFSEVIADKDVEEYLRKKDREEFERLIEEIVGDGE